MRKLLLVTGFLLAAASIGCGTKTPSGPGSVTVTQTTTSTTTTAPPTTTTISSSTTTSAPVVPAASARRYVAFNAPPNAPADMTLFLQLIFGQAPSSASSFLSRLRIFPLADPSYAVAGVFTTGSGIGGTVKGTLAGGPTPLDSGAFDGSLTANLPDGCSAERQFLGSLSSQVLQWNAGRSIRDCPSSTQSWPGTFTLLRTDAPLPTTTIGTTTTTVPPSTTSTTTTTTTSVPPAADLVPFTPTGNYCRVNSSGDLVVTVINQGNGNAGAFVTRLSYTPGTGASATADVSTTGLVAGASIDVTFANTRTCGISNCPLSISVDPNNQVTETTKANNGASGTCVAVG